MTIGIYLLKFNNTEKVYVGQSINIEKRYNQHKNSLINKTANYKLLEAYKLYGMPLLEILIDCTIPELNKLEELAISIYNSVDNGFNILDKVNSTIQQGKSGDLNANSKYTNEQILMCLDILINTTSTHQEISNITGVSKRVIEGISDGTKHKWLHIEYPEKYNLLLSKKIKKERPTLVSPTGEYFKDIPNIAEFARKHKLIDSNLYGLLNGKRKSHKGWTII